MIVRASSLTKHENQRKQYQFCRHCRYICVFCLSRLLSTLDSTYILFLSRNPRSRSHSSEIENCFLFSPRSHHLMLNPSLFIRIFHSWFMQDFDLPAGARREWWIEMFFLFSLPRSQHVRNSPEKCSISAEEFRSFLAISSIVADMISLFISSEKRKEKKWIVWERELSSQNYSAAVDGGEKSRCHAMSVRKKYVKVLAA